MPLKSALNLLFQAVILDATEAKVLYFSSNCADFNKLRKEGTTMAVHCPEGPAKVIDESKAFFRKFFISLKSKYKDAHGKRKSSLWWMRQEKGVLQKDEETLSQNIFAFEDKEVVVMTHRSSVLLCDG